MSLAIERVESATAEARALIGALDAELSPLYAPDQRHALNIEQVFRPGIAFFVARLVGVAAGCGGVAFGDGVAEV